MYISLIIISILSTVIVFTFAMMKGASDADDKLYGDEQYENN